MQNMPFGSYLLPNRHNSSILKQIWVRDYDGDVGCLTGSKNMAVSRMRNEKYAIWPSVMAKSPKLLHSSAMDWETRLWGRYHVPQNVFLVRILIHKNVSGCTTCTLHCAAFYTSFRLSLTSIGLKLSFTTASISSASRFPRRLEINVHSMSTRMQKTST